MTIQLFGLLIMKIRGQKCFQLESSCGGKGMMSATISAVLSSFYQVAVDYYAENPALFVDVHL